MANNDMEVSIGNLGVLLAGDTIAMKTVHVTKGTPTYSSILGSFLIP